MAKADEVVDPRAKLCPSEIDHPDGPVIVQSVPGLIVAVGGHHLDGKMLDGGNRRSQSAQHWPRQQPVRPFQH